MNHKKFPVTNIGTSLILAVFIILALVTFATLSVVNSNHDYQSSKKVADRITAYYDASNKAEMILAQVDDTLAYSYSVVPDKYYANAEQNLAAVDNIELDFSAAHPSIEYTIPFDGSRALQVKLLLSNPQTSSAGYYEIQTWQEISTKEWSGDEKLHLLQQ